MEYLFPYAKAPQDICDLLHRPRLTQALFNAPPGDWEAGERSLAALPARCAEFQTRIATALTYVEATGVKRRHVMSGNADARNDDSRRAYEDSLRLACEAAGKVGADIVIEPINSRDMPGYFLNDFGYALDTIKQLRLPQIKLQYDIYHRQILHSDILKSLERMMPWIGHV